MVSFTDITGLAGGASVIAAAMMLLPGVAGLAKPRLGLVVGAVVIFMLTPLGGLPLAAYVRGVIGDLSITTMVLLLCVILRPLLGWSPADAGARLGLPLIAVAALTLYPLALGVGLFDPYRLGYGNPWFLATLLALALVAWFRQGYLIALCIAFATFAWAVGWYESTNLWDYLLDPLVSIYAVSAILSRGVKRIWNPQPGTRSNHNVPPRST
jgi:hypothetical protein